MEPAPGTAILDNTIQGWTAGSHADSTKFAGDEFEFRVTDRCYVAGEDD